MILSNQLQDTLADIQDVASSVNQLEIAVPNAADILCFLRDTSEAANAIRLKTIIPFAEQIPALSGNILELHFGKNTVDFATRLNIDFDKPLIEGVKGKQYRLPFVNNGFVKLMRQEENGFAYGIKNIWIEYDTPFHDAPALFFDINKSDAFHPQSVYNNLQQVTGVFGWSANERLLHFLEQVQQAGLHTVYYGLMFSRATKSVRLTINGIHAEQLTDKLKALGWKGNYGALEKLAANYLMQEQKLVVGVDFGDGVEDRIGIEVFDTNPGTFVQTLYKDKHISKADYDLLNTWEQRFKLPANLRTALSQLHERPVSWLYTRINHFKFVFDSTAEIAVKGYLYYCF